MSHLAEQIKNKLADIAARSAAFQKKSVSAQHDAVTEELTKAHAEDAKADGAELEIRTLHRESARAHHALAQSAAAQRLLETLADEILERYEQVLTLQLVILERGSEDTDRLMEMSSTRWASFLTEKRNAFGDKLVNEAVELAAL